MEKVLLIDGHSILNRAFYGVPPFTNAEGIHTNAIYGFLNIFFKLYEIENPDYVAVAFDVHAKTFRHERYEEYKGTRKPMADELRQQVPLLKEVLKSMNISIFEMPGFEADDILGTISLDAQNKGFEVTVVSGDRDLLQLASETVKISMPKTIKGNTTTEDYYAKDVLEKYKVTPTQFIDVKALMGDSSDNIKGVAGIGDKTATNLIGTYGSVDGIYEHIDELKNGRAKTNLIEGKEDAYFSQFLVTIKRDVPVEYTFDEIKVGNFYTPECLEYMKRFEFKSFLKRFEFDESDNKFELQMNEINDMPAVLAELEKLKDAKEVGISIISEGKESKGCAICYEEGKCSFIPFEYFVTDDMVFEKLNEIDFSKTQTTMMDVKGGLKHIGLHNTDDLSVMLYLLDPLKNEYTYDYAAYSLLGIQLPSEEELFGKNKISDLFYSDRSKVLARACYEAYVSFAGVKAGREKLEEAGMLKLYEDIEKPLIWVLDDMEKRGIAVDRETLVKYGERLAGDISEIEARIYEQAGHEFNINSPKQLGVIMFEEMGFEGGKKTKTGYSTNASVLEKLSDKYPFVKDILQYRSLTKLKSTYADGLLNYIGSDGRIHGTFNQTVTATGRISSTEPNLQNIPIRMELGRQLREVFIPKAGHVFIDADYSQIELRILAHLSNDPVLIDSYNENEDIHKITASKVFKVPLEEVTKELRGKAKAVNFGIVYGISAFGLGEDLSISSKEADQYIKEYFKTYPGIEDYLNGLIKTAEDTGYVYTMFNRRRPVPEIKASNFMQKKFGERIAMNSPIQGSAADIMKIAMINVYNKLLESDLEARMVLQVHDEIIIECPENEKEQVAQIVKDTMEGAADLLVALNAEVGIGENWLAAH